MKHIGEMNVRFSQTTKDPTEFTNECLRIADGTFELELGNFL